MNAFWHMRAIHPCRSWLQFILGLLFGVCACSAYGQTTGEFQVEKAHAWNADGAYLIDAQFSVQLSSGAREALDNGVPLVLEFQVQVVKINNWFWDTVETDLTLRRQLQYHALSRSYLVKDVSAGSQSNYRRIEDALRASGAISGLSLLSERELDGSRYLVRIRGNLDIESLPTPVRLLAYVSSAWDMASEWYAWPLVR